MPAAAGDARGDRARDAAVAALGRALQARVRRRAAPATRCSASCRAATIRRCASQSARALVGMGFQGYAIGGLAVGEPQDVMLAMIETVAPASAGGPAALSDGRRHAGRYARGGRARHRHVRLRDADAQRPPRRWPSPGFGPINLQQCAPRRRSAPLDEESDIRAARDYSRAYLHHLVKANEMLGAMLLSPGQSRLLPGADARRARGDRGRAALPDYRAIAKEQGWARGRYRAALAPG